MKMVQVFLKFTKTLQIAFMKLRVNFSILVLLLEFQISFPSFSCNFAEIACNFPSFFPCYMFAQKIFVILPKTGQKVEKKFKQFYVCSSNFTIYQK